jgi:hypothetical protein
MAAASSSQARLVALPRMGSKGEGRVGQRFRQLSGIRNPSAKVQRVPHPSVFRVRFLTLPLLLVPVRFPIEKVMRPLCRPSLVPHRMPPRPCIARRSTGIHFCTFVQFCRPSPRNKISRDHLYCLRRSLSGASKGGYGTPSETGHTPCCHCGIASTRDVRDF